MNRRNIQLETDISFRGEDDAVLWAKLSATRMGEQDKETVKSGYHVDYLSWYPIFFGKNEKECEKWLDTNHDWVVKQAIPYEV